MNFGNQVTLHVDLSFEDHVMMKWAMSFFGIDPESVIFPDHLSNQVAIKGTSYEVFRILAILRWHAPIVAFVDLPVGFSAEQVLHIVNTFNMKSSIELRPFWSGVTNSIYFFARQEHTSFFVHVVTEVLQFLECIGVRDPPVYSPIRIDAINHLHMEREITRLESYGVENTTVSIPKFTGSNEIHSVFCINGRPEEVLNMKQRITGYLPAFMVFDFKYGTVNEEFLQTMLDQYELTICVSPKNVAIISCSEMYSNRMYYAYELMVKMQNEKTIEHPRMMKSSNSTDSNEETDENVDEKTSDIFM